MREDLEEELVKMKNQKAIFKHEKTYISSEAKSIPTTQELEKKDLNIQSR